MSKYEQISPTAFKTITFGPGVILSDFDPENGIVHKENILYATKDGNVLNATRELLDMGVGLDNVPEGTMQLQKAKPYQITGNTTIVTFSPDALKRIIGSTDSKTFGGTGVKLNLRNQIYPEDFQDFWIVTNYSEFNGEKNGGMCAYHIKNAMSTSGLNATHKKDEKGETPYNYKCFYDINNIDEVPFEIFIKAGTEEEKTSVTSVTISGTAQVGQTLSTTVEPSEATVTYKWEQSDTQSDSYSDIPGETNPTLTLTSNHLNKYIKVTVTGNGNYKGTVTSTATEQITGAL